VGVAVSSLHAVSFPLITLLCTGGLHRHDA